MALNKNSNKYKALIRNLAKARRMRSAKAKAKRNGHEVATAAPPEGAAHWEARFVGPGSPMRAKVREWLERVIMEELGAQ